MKRRKRYQVPFLAAALFVLVGSALAAAGAWNVVDWIRDGSGRRTSGSIEAGIGFLFLAAAGASGFLHFAAGAIALARPAAARRIVRATAWADFLLCLLLTLVTIPMGFGAIVFAGLGFASLKTWHACREPRPRPPSQIDSRGALS